MFYSFYLAKLPALKTIIKNFEELNLQGIRMTCSDFFLFFFKHEALLF